MLGRFGYIGNSIAYIYLLDGKSPNGIALPKDIGRLHLTNGKLIYWASGVAMLMPTPAQRNTDQLMWSDAIDESLSDNALVGRLWGEWIDAWDDSMIDPPTKFDQIPYDPSVEYPIVAPISSLLAELLAQWHYFNDLCNSAFESGDLDRAQNAADYAYALNGIAQNMFDRRFML